MYTTFTHSQVQGFVHEVMGTSSQDEFAFFPQGISKFHFSSREKANKAGKWFDDVGMPYTIIDGDRGKAVIGIPHAASKRLSELATEWAVYPVVEPFLRQCLRYRDSQTIVTDQGALMILCSYDPEFELALYNGIRKAVECKLLPNTALDRTNGTITIKNVDLLKGLENLGCAKARQAYLMHNERPAINNDIWKATVAIASDPGKKAPDPHGLTSGLTYQGTVAAVKHIKDETKRLGAIERGNGAPKNGSGPKR